MEKEEIAAMAVAAIAEELQTDIKRVRILSFDEIQESDLEDN